MELGIILSDINQFHKDQYYILLLIFARFEVKNKRKIRS
jgi:hypothetical protein